MNAQFYLDYFTIHNKDTTMLQAALLEASIEKAQMEAANAQRQHEGCSLAYSELDFRTLSDDLHAVIKEYTQL